MTYQNTGKNIFIFISFVKFEIWTKDILENFFFNISII